MTILYGLISLSFIIFIHELGHFLAARLCGVTVESFSIGMGPILLRKKIGLTEYRLSLFPLGGYCGMKGQKDFQLALDNNTPDITADKDSFYGVSPLKRIVIAFTGPLFNFIFAFTAFSIIAMIGYTSYTSPSKIILASELYPETFSAAENAGLKTGDVIITIDNNPIKYFNDISSIVSLNPEKSMQFTVNRNGVNHTFTVTPQLDKKTGAGKIGVLSWIDPVIKSTIENSGAAKAGLKANDIIVSVNDQIIQHSTDFYKYSSNLYSYNVKILRDSNILTIENITSIISEKTGKPIHAGIYFNYIEIPPVRKPFLSAVKYGFIQSFSTLALTLKSIGLLFKGVDPTEAVSGPIRITVMLGDTVKNGFANSFSVGIVSILDFLALISISLFFMNLLPIPVLDGGLIVFSLIEIFSKRQVSPKLQYYIQFIGIAFILFLFSFSLFGDIKFLIK